MLGRKEGGKETLPTRVAGLTIFSPKPFLARLLLPEADFSFQEVADEKRVKGPLFYFTVESVVPYQLLQAPHWHQRGSPSRGLLSLGSAKLV